MALPRVYDVAKELGIDTKVALAKLEELGEYVKGGSSTIAPPVAAKLRAAFPKKEKPAEKRKAEKPQAAAKPATPEVAEAPAEKPSAKPAETPSEKPAPLQGIPRPGNNPFSSNQGMGIPRPMARPGNNPFSSNQGMGRPRPQGALARASVRLGLARSRVVHSVQAAHLDPVAASQEVSVVAQEVLVVDQAEHAQAAVSQAGPDPEAAVAAEPELQELLVKAAQRVSLASQSGPSARNLSSARHPALAVQWFHAETATPLFGSVAERQFRTSPTRLAPMLAS